MMMQGEAYSWIGVLAVAPVVMVLTAWFLVLFHGYKTKWRSMDVFLVGLFCQQLLTVLLSFLWTVLELVHPTIVPELCAILLWSFTSIRSLHLATLASLAIDRTLTILWPYRYRLSVRKSQVKYHLFVLTLLATFVGMAAVFAQKHALEPCSFLPHTLQSKFAIFSVCLQALLLLVTVGCTVVVQCHLCTLPEQGVCHAPSDLAPLGGHSGSNTSTTSSSRPLQKSAIADDLRGTTLSVIALFCSTLDYLPHIAMTVLDLFWTEYLPLWPLENLSIWVYVGEGLLVPVFTAMVDAPLNTALRKALSKDLPQYTRQGGTIHDTRFRMFHRDMQDIKFPITNGSLVSNFVPTLNRIPQAKGTRMGVGTCDGSNTRTSFTSHDQRHKDHIYATLSETYGSNSTLEEGFLSDEPCNSLTTVANDDFVFHNIRPSNIKPRPRNLKENTTQTTPKATPRKMKKRDEGEDHAGFDNPGYENQVEHKPIVPSLSLNAIDALQVQESESRPKRQYVRKGKKGAKRSVIEKMHRENSVVSLFAQLDSRGAVSDTGEFLPVHSSASLPDFKTIFISDYI